MTRQVKKESERLEPLTYFIADRRGYTVSWMVGEVGID